MSCVNHGDGGTGLRQRGSGADKGQRCPDCCGSCSHGIGDIRPAVAPPQGRQAVAQCRKRLRRLTCMHVVAVFAQRHVTHVMRGAFNRPVAAPPLLQQHSTRLAHREVGHPAEHRAGRFPRALYVALTRPVHDSCCPGPLKRGAIAGGVFQVPNLQGPVAVADRLDAVPLLVVSDDGRQIEE